MLSSSSFSSFSQEDFSKLRFSERSFFLEDSEASFVPCNTDFRAARDSRSSLRARIKDRP